MVDIYKFLFVSYSKSVQGQFALTRFSEKKTKNKKSDHKVINSGFHGNWSFPHNTASHERKWGFESILLPWWQSFGEFLVDSFSSFLWFVSFRWRNDFGGEKQTNKKKTNVCNNPLRVPIPHMFSLYTLPSSLHCCWLLTASVLCDDGAFCCFWGCGLSCCWCLWWWDCCCCCCCGCCCCCSCGCCCGCVAWVKVPCCWSGKAACRISCVDWLLWRRRGPWQQDNAMILDNEGNSSPSAHSLVSLKVLNIYKCKWHSVHLRHTLYNFIIIRNIIKMKYLYSKIKHECYPIIPCLYNILNQWHLLPSSDTCRNCCCCCCPCWLLCATTAVWFWPSGCPWGAWAGCRVSVWVCPPCWSGTEG